MLALTVVLLLLAVEENIFGRNVNDFYTSAKEARPLWSRGLDQFLARPIPWLGLVLRADSDPDRIEGFLWTAGALCWLNGFLLFALLRRLVPHAGSFPVIAGVLLIINQSDSGDSIFSGRPISYWTALFLLLFSFWLLLFSLKHQSRLLLIASCLVLSFSLMTNEGGFPLALLGLAFIWLRKEEMRSRVLWSAA